MKWRAPSSDSSGSVFKYYAVSQNCQSRSIPNTKSFHTCQAHAFTICTEVMLTYLPFAYWKEIQRPYALTRRQLSKSRWQEVIQTARDSSISEACAEPFTSLCFTLSLIKVRGGVTALTASRLLPQQRVAPRILHCQT